MGIGKFRVGAKKIDFAGAGRNRNWKTVHFIIRRASSPPLQVLALLY